MGLFHIRGEKLSKQGFAVQVAAFNHRDGLLRKIAELQKLFFRNVLINYDNLNSVTMIYKVLMGPFSTELQALSYQKSLNDKNIKGFIVDLTTL